MPTNAKDIASLARAGEMPGPWGSLTPVRAVSRVFVIRVKP